MNKYGYSVPAWSENILSLSLDLNFWWFVGWHSLEGLSIDLERVFCSLKLMITWLLWCHKNCVLMLLIRFENWYLKRHRAGGLENFIVWKVSIINFNIRSIPRIYKWLSLFTQDSCCRRWIRFSFEYPLRKYLIHRLYLLTRRKMPIR